MYRGVMDGENFDTTQQKEATTVVERQNKGKSVCLSAFRSSWVLQQQQSKIRGSTQLYLAPAEERPRKTSIDDR